jgi:gp16 family phage-associated protein
MKKQQQRKLNINPFEVRAHFIRQGTFLAYWAKERGYALDTVYRAVRNERHGKISRQIVRALLNETKE